MARAPRITPVILAGGRGVRLWPLSRADHAKQVLPLLGGRSLLQETAARVDDRKLFHPPLVLTNETLRFSVAEQLEEEAAIVLEPFSRNTAPAIAAAARMLHAQDRDAVMLVLPSDHAIRNREAFLRMVEQGEAAAQAGRLVLFGIAPDEPATHYGYIRRGAASGASIYPVEGFAEKPAPSFAVEYLADGNYDWNSGMFLMKAATLLEEMERFMPELLRYSDAAVRGLSRDMRFLRLHAEAFARCPDISIDYALMEKTARAVVVRDDPGWSDLGTWSSIWAAAVKDEDGNALCGDVLQQGCSASYLRSEGRLLACIGLGNMLVVDTADATLVAPLDNAGDLKALVRELETRRRPEVASHTTVCRPWGSYTVLVRQPGFQVKRLIVKPGRRLSLQRHIHRSEHWVVVRGTACVTCGGKQFSLRENESAFIPAGELHRLANASEEALQVIEVQVGAYLGEDDIVREKEEENRDGGWDNSAAPERVQREGGAERVGAASLERNK